MRQSEGNRTENRPSAIRLVQESMGGGTIERLATSTLAPLARIRSSLLLKTCLLMVGAGKLRPSPHTVPSIAVTVSARQRCGWTWPEVSRT